MHINRRVLIVLSIVISACTGQSTPIISTLEENTITSLLSATPASQTLPLFFTTPQTPNASIFIIPTTSAEPAPNTTLELNLDIESDPILRTGGGVSGDVKSDNSKVFQIPVIGGFIPVTGFPPGMITGEKINLPSIHNLTNPMLIIPSLNVNIPILEINLMDGTWDVGWLWDQAGWLEGTAYPSRNGNSVLTAHVVTADGKNGPFAHLKTLTVDDYVFINNFGYRYIYKVNSINLVKPSDMSVFSHEDDSWLTLITCDSYDEETGIYLLRVIVRARLVEVQEIE